MHYQYNVTLFPKEAAISYPPILPKLLSIDMTFPLMFILVESCPVLTHLPLPYQCHTLASWPTCQTLLLHSSLHCMCPTQSRSHTCTNCGGSHVVFYRSCPQFSDRKQFFSSSLLQCCLTSICSFPLYKSFTSQIFPTNSLSEILEDIQDIQNYAFRKNCSSSTLQSLLKFPLYAQ